MNARFGEKRHWRRSRALCGSLRRTADGGGFESVDGGQRRGQVLRRLRACSRPAANGAAWLRRSRACRFGRAFWDGAHPGRFLPREGDCSREQIALDDPVDQAQPNAAGALIGHPNAHLRRAATPTSRGKRCVPSAPGMMPR